MNNSIFQIKEKIDNSIVNNRYIYLDEKTKFIYNNSSLSEIVGINNLLNGKIVEINEEIEKENKKLARLKVDNKIVGWTEIKEDNLIRLYRVPKISGKLNISINVDDIFYNTRQEDIIKQLSQKILKVQYIFYYNNEKYLNVTRVDGKKSIFIKESKFNRLIIAEEGATIFLEAGEPLYSTSNFAIKASSIKIAKDYKVISYINKTEEVKVLINDKNYWVKAKRNFDNFYDELCDRDTLEILDFITYLYENNKYNEGRVKILNNKIDKIRESITYNNEFEEIKLNNYLGDSYDD